MKTSTSKNKKIPLKKQLHKHVKLAVVPHKANQYRPHLIRRYGIVAIFVAIVSVQLTYNMTTTGTVLGDRASITIATLAEGTNDARQQQGINPVTVNQQLNQAAYLKAKDMFAQQYWAHIGPDGSQPWKWFEQAGYNYAEAGENLAKNFYTAEAATAAWMQSSEHRMNMLKPEYTDVGFAVVTGTLQDKPTTIVVALFGAPAQESVAGVQTPVVMPTTGSAGPLTQLGVALQSMTPALLGSMVLLGIGVIVAIVAHAYRRQLPKVLRQSWYRHHGAMKAGGMLSVMVIMVALYSGGQI